MTNTALPSLMELGEMKGGKRYCKNVRALTNHLTREKEVSLQNKGDAGDSPT